MNPKFNEQSRDKKGKFATKKQICKQNKMKTTGKSNEGRKTLSQNVQTEPKHPCQGNRVVDLSFMSEKMFCEKCEEPLLIQNIISEKIKGLASTFLIYCSKCSFLSEVDSSKKYVPKTKSGKSAKPLFEINTKVALGE